MKKHFIPNSRILILLQMYEKSLKAALFAAVNFIVNCRSAGIRYSVAMQKVAFRMAKCHLLDAEIPSFKS